VHRRDQFADVGPSRRHLVRMHLRSERRGWSIPPPLRPFWDAAFKEDGVQNWHIDPMTETYFPLAMMADA